MRRFNRLTCGWMAVAAIACAPMAPAMAGGHGFVHVHAWGFGHGLLGAVVGLATLPIVVASAAISAATPEVAYPSAGYDAGPRGYAAPPAYYSAPQTYYGPPAAAYYPRP